MNFDGNILKEQNALIINIFRHANAHTHKNNAFSSKIVF